MDYYKFLKFDIILVHYDISFASCYDSKGHVSEF